jgi:hypothetical protein
MSNLERWADVLLLAGFVLPVVGAGLWWWGVWEWGIVLAPIVGVALLWVSAVTRTLANIADNIALQTRLYKAQYLQNREHNT